MTVFWFLMPCGLIDVYQCYNHPHGVRIQTTVTDFHRPENYISEKSVASCFQWVDELSRTSEFYMDYSYVTHWRTRTITLYLLSLEQHRNCTSNWYYTLKTQVFTMLRGMGTSVEMKWEHGCRNGSKASLYTSESPDFNAAEARHQAYWLGPSIWCSFPSHTLPEMVSTIQVRFPELRSQMDYCLIVRYCNKPF
jgi:hypothetical protein